MLFYIVQVYMKCPECGEGSTQVKDSRNYEEGNYIKRRRICNKCGKRFNTFERIEHKIFWVVKQDGTRVPFDKQKLLKSIATALIKRPITFDSIDIMVNSIIEKLMDRCSNEVSSKEIANQVMKYLKRVDKVGYVRFISVHRSFSDIEDFLSIIGKIAV